MKLSFTEEQQALRRMLRTIFSERWTLDLARSHRYNGSSEGLDDLWRELSVTGVLGMPFPDEMGGGGGSLVDLGLVFWEAGRSLSPASLTANYIFGLAIAELAAPEHGRLLISQIAEGKLRGTAHLWNSDDASDYRPTVYARHVNEGWLLSGRLEYVRSVHNSNAIILHAEIEANKDMAAFIVRPGQPGCDMQVHKAFGNDDQATVLLSEYYVPPDDRISCASRKSISGAISWISNAALALQCMEMVGGMEAVLQRTVAYLKQRTQFGRPLGSFQAVQHQIADLRIGFEGARLAALQAINMVAARHPADRVVAIAQMICGRAYTKSTLSAHQLQGGMGYARESDLHLWSERAKLLELVGGTPHVQRRNLAKTLGFS